MTTEKNLPYRGKITGLLGVGGVLAFVTEHAEQQPTAVYRVDIDKQTLTADALPAGGMALAVDGETLWIVGTDHRVYHAPLRGGAPVPVGPAFDAPTVAQVTDLKMVAQEILLLSGGRLAVLSGQSVLVLNRADGKLLQSLPLPETPTAAAVDPTGRWLAVGTARGTITIFECEDKPDFQPSASQRLHDAAVTALLFENEELRFFSAGADHKLLCTHARGKLEPEDKGRGNNHEDIIVRMAWGPGDRLLTGSRDATVKAWPRVGGVKPVTLKDGVGVVVDLAVAERMGRPVLVVAADDNSLRFFPFDDKGKPQEAMLRIGDALAGAKAELEQTDATRREAALKELAGYRDEASLELIAGQIQKDADHGVRLNAAQLLAAAKHPHVPKLLEKFIGHADRAVRVEAFEGLRRQLGVEDLHPLELALKGDKADVGQLAIAALETLASRDERAHSRLVKALDAKASAVREAALTSLVKVHGEDAPDGALTALASKHADIRRKALLLLFRKNLLGSPRVGSALRRRTEDEEADVRRTAFLLTLHASPQLLQTLRSRDAELARQLNELEGKKAQPEGEAAPASESGRHARAFDPTLPDSELAPLLQATASRSVDTCLAGARGLAMLGDPRAFGLLLQLSRDATPAARVEACRALAALDDPRSVQRLRSLLYDPDPLVRQAAFAALDQVHAGDPLLAAESGLNAGFEDVRSRGLQALVAQARKELPQQSGDRAWQLLVRALNDNFAGVRGEAFKAALNLKIAGGGVQTLRFALQSVHPDVRREVLTEVMAQSAEPWAWNLLLEFYNDHDPKLRAEAFEYAVKKAKGPTELTPLADALRAQFSDVRKLAVDALVKKHSPAAQSLLVTALADAEKEIRQAAVAALVSADAREPLAEALKSPHADVRVRAARALARHGDVACLEPLLALVKAPEPTERERQADWAAAVEGALEGLAELGDMSALPHVAPVIHSKYPALRKAAAAALVWVALPAHVETLRQALQHSDPNVKYRAALGLAFAGDGAVAALVFSEAAKPVLSAQERLTAAFLLGAAGAEPMSTFLDETDEKLRDQAAKLLFLRELAANEDAPVNCLACLASRHPHVGLKGAIAIEYFADRAALVGCIRIYLGQQGAKPWAPSAETAVSFAELLLHGSPPARARSALLVRFLTESESGPWDQAWAAHAARFARELTAVTEAEAEREDVPSRYSRRELRQVAAGYYVSLLRYSGTDWNAGHVRKLGLQWLRKLVDADAATFRPQLTPLFLQALADPNQEVRIEAFDYLQAMDVDRAALAAEALESGHVDLGVRGLQLLSGGASAAEGQAVLENAMRTRKDDLALEAAKLLVPQRGAVAVAGRALDAAAENARGWAVETLAAAPDTDETARKLLRQAVESRHQKVRTAAAVALAAKKDPAAFDALVKLMSGQRRGTWHIEPLVSLGDPRTPKVLLDRVLKDGSDVADELIEAAAGFRQPESADALLTLFDRPDRREAAFNALITVSGFDQGIEDSQDERPDKTWEKKQHPRHTGVLARIMERCFDRGETDYLEQMFDGAGWARGTEVDPILALLTQHPQDSIRQRAIEVVGWRARKRKGPVEPLVRALASKDAVAQFLAAEGLARAGRNDGCNVLLAAVDFMTELYLRTRAISALGELGDERGLDLLLKLAAEDGHALQDSAAEAIGHLGRSERAEDIFRLLERYARSEGSVAEAALRGLRWFNSPEGWKLVRRRAEESHFVFRATAVEMLGYNDDPATRDLLLKLLSQAVDDWEIVEKALVSARRVLGEASLDPDYAAVQTPLDLDMLAYLDAPAPLDRVCQQGDARRIFEILPKCQPAIQAELATSLLNRTTVPIAEARAALGSADEGTVPLAARLLARADDRSPQTAAALKAALLKWRTTWEEGRDQAARTGRTDTHLQERITPCLEGLLWAAGRLGAATDVVLAMATALVDAPAYRPVRRAAVFALTANPLSAEVAQALEAILSGDDAELRTVVADALGRHKAAKAATLAEQALSDRVSFNRLATHRIGEMTGTLRAAAAKVHYQGVALPHLIARGDADTLGAVAGNRRLPLATRVGAVEGLGKLGLEAVEARIVKIAEAEDDDEELRKAAWRALRRSRRAREKLKTEN